MSYDMKCSDIVNGEWCTGELSIVNGYPKIEGEDLSIEYLCDKCDRSYLVVYMIKYVRGQDRQAIALGMADDASNLCYHIEFDNDRGIDLEVMNEIHESRI